MQLQGTHNSAAQFPPFGFVVAGAVDKEGHGARVLFKLKILVKDWWLQVEHVSTRLWIRDYRSKVPRVQGCADLFWRALLYRCAGVLHKAGILTAWQAYEVRVPPGSRVEGDVRVALRSSRI